MGRTPKIDWEPIKALYLAGKTSREIALIFNISDANIRNKAGECGWGKLRKQLAALPPPKDPSRDTRAPKSANTTVEPSQEIGFGLQSQVSNGKGESNDTISRAIRLRNSDNFRERVIAQADKALTTLEKAVVSNIFETDRFAEALTKVERIGARAYGYDREGDHPIVNIGILGSGSEYDIID
jgi:hypothetical protein